MGRNFSSLVLDVLGTTAVLFRWKFLRPFHPLPTPPPPPAAAAAAPSRRRDPSFPRKRGLSASSKPTDHLVSQLVTHSVHSLTHSGEQRTGKPGEPSCQEKRERGGKLPQEQRIAKPMGHSFVARWGQGFVEETKLLFSKSR